MMNNVLTEDLVRLDELLEDLSNQREAGCGLIREHLASARLYLIGFMPTEYALNLQMAGEKRLSSVFPIPTCASEF